MGHEVSELGRFSDPALFVLVSLAGGEKHGYAMMEDIERTCGTRLGPGCERHSDGGDVHFLLHHRDQLRHVLLDTCSIV
jgi:hypothetical protein